MYHQPLFWLRWYLSNVPTTQISKITFKSVHGSRTGSASRFRHRRTPTRLSPVHASSHSPVSWGASSRKTMVMLASISRSLCMHASCPSHGLHSNHFLRERLEACAGPCKMAGSVIGTSHIIQPGWSVSEVLPPVHSRKWTATTMHR